MFQMLTGLHKTIESGKKLEIMISGAQLAVLLNDVELSDLLEKVLSNAAAVIIFRAKPMDKANVVKFIRHRNRTKITLAIGDGANDVNMIQSAHIGVGIRGKEGNQASMFADYSIQEFRGLRRLIFWHGRNFSQRLVDFICLCVWKNMSISTCLSFYNCFAGFSGLQQCEQIYWMMFNSNMTLTAIAGNFFFDQDVPFERSASDPNQQMIPGEPVHQLKQTIKSTEIDKSAKDLAFHEHILTIYDKETRRVGFKITEYYVFHRDYYQKTMMGRAVTYWVMAFYNGFVAFAIPCFGYSVTQMSNGTMEDLFATCFVSLVCIVAAEHFVAYTRVRSWNAGVLWLLAFAVLNHIVDVVFVEYVAGREINKHQFTMMQQPKFWLVVFAAITVQAMPFYA